MRPRSDLACRVFLLFLVQFFVPAILPVSAQEAEIQAHRGGRGLWPENTLSAFRRAIEMGVTTLELDLAATKDRILVISHDPILSGTLVRNSDGAFLEPEEERLIKDLTSTELREYKVGRINRRSDYYYRFREQRPVSDERIPSLEQLFDMTREISAQTRVDLFFNIEIKTYPPFPDYTIENREFVSLLLDVLEKRNLKDYVTIQSFDWRNLLLVREMAPDISIACLAVNHFTIQGVPYNLQRGRPGSSPWLAGYDVDDYMSVPELVSAFGADVYSPYYREISEADVRDVHKRGLKVIPWTVNDEETADRLISWGVDGIITDRPDILMDMIQNP